MQRLVFPTSVTVGGFCITSDCESEECEATDSAMSRMCVASNPLAMLDGEGLIRATIDMCRHVSVHPLLSVFMPSEDESYNNQVSEISLRKCCISKYVKRLNNF